jgi:hypothetical protein
MDSQSAGSLSNGSGGNLYTQPVRTPESVSRMTGLLGSSGVIRAIGRSSLYPVRKTGILQVSLRNLLKETVWHVVTRRHSHRSCLPDSRPQPRMINHPKEG